MPSPSSVLLLLGASALGRPLFGVLLVIAYGAGMAATLLATGIVLTVGRRWLLDRGAGRAMLPNPLYRMADALPMETACLIVLVGAFLSGRGIDQLIS